MRTITRAALRFLALAVLLAVTVGVPVLVISAVGAPWPSGSQWSAAWRTHRVDTDMAMRVGASVFVLLWAWFMVTAVIECIDVLRRPSGREAAPAIDRSSPSGWVRLLVRVAMLGVVTASVAAPTLTSAQAPAGHVVVAGDSYWRIADDHLAEVLHRDPSPHEVAEYTDALVAWNSPRLGHREPTLIIPGEVVDFPDEQGIAVPDPPAEPITPVLAEAALPVAPSAALPEAIDAGSVTAGSPSATGVASVQGPPWTGATASPTPPQGSSRNGRSALEGLGAAVMLAAGALAAVHARRRRGLVRSLPASRAVMPTMQQTRTELRLRAVSGAERIARLDLALRSAATDLAAQRTLVSAAVVGEEGDIRLYLDGAAVPSDPAWRLDPHAGLWLLPGWVALEDLARSAVGHAQPCPAMVHIGTADEGGDVFVDLEALGVLAVDSPHGSGIVRGIASSLAMSPLRDCGRLLLVGTALSRSVGGFELDSVEPAHTMAEAFAEARRAVAGIRSRSVGTTTFALRSLGAGGEGWEPIVIAADGASAYDLEGDLAEVVPGAGLGVVTSRGSSDVRYRLSADGDRHVLEPFGIRLVPLSVDVDDLHSVADLLHAADRVAAVEPFDFLVPSAVSDDRPPLEFEEPDWSLMVRLLGRVEVVDREGRPVLFDRTKSLELVAWLSQHRERPTRSSARAGLWEVDVRDATFANVVSDARRSMAKLVAPPDGEEWLGRTLSDDLPLHSYVITDAEMLACRLGGSRRLPDAAAIEVLRPAVELITGMPFAGTSFLWADAEGHASALSIAATGAAIELANRYLALDDLDGVFWATGQGLKVLAGHEELIALRMRAHARRGDLAGVRHEWEAYERSLAADTWAPMDPSPKLVALRRELMSVPVGAVGD